MQKFRNSMGVDRILLILDNLSAQKGQAFLRRCEEMGFDAVFGPSAAGTHNWQPADAGGVMSTIKALARLEQQAFLESPVAWEKWVQGKFKASEKRVLVTTWVGNAWQKWCGRQYGKQRKDAFERTGCGTVPTSTGSAIQVLGLNDHDRRFPDDTLFTDDAYIRRHCALHPEFRHTLIEYASSSSSSSTSSSSEGDSDAEFSHGSSSSTGTPASDDVPLADLVPSPAY